jgi:glycine C-acetyltransferase
MEDAILFPSCFDANGGIFEALLTPKDAVFSDELNHASIIDGIRLCKAGTKERYKHLSVSDLEKKLQFAVSKGPEDQVRLIVTDGVFSMDGDIARLDKLVALTSKYPNTYVMIDECHATGALGPGGRGTPAIFKVQPDLISSTLGKALGGATGGYITQAARETLSFQ